MVNIVIIDIMIDRITEFVILYLILFLAYWGIKKARKDIKELNKIK